MKKKKNDAPVPDESGSQTREIEALHKQLNMVIVDRDDLARKLKEFTERSQRAEVEAEEWKKRWTVESTLRENLQLQLDQLKKVPR